MSRMSNSRGGLSGGAGLAAAGLAAGALVALGWARTRLVVVTVDGASMLPTLRDGDRVPARRRPLHRVRRGDVVVLEPPSDGPYLPGPAGPDGRAWNVKRVAAVPGDPVPDGALAVLGDNPDSVVFADRDDGSGVALSGGQWQRLALARAFLRQSRDLLLLDEPSSGLDADAEHAVHASLRRHRRGRTSVLISHRLGAVRDADVIVVLSEGRITERGTHDELMALQGEYARLFSLQADGYARS